MSYNILVCEDEKDMAEIYSEKFSQQGYNTDITNDGESCLKQYDANYDESNGSSYDVVILDYVMPQKNGADVAKEILQINPNQRIIFVSAFGQDLLSDLQDIDINIELIPKPVNFESLVNLIEGSQTKLTQKLRKSRSSSSDDMYWSD